MSQSFVGDVLSAGLMFAAGPAAGWFLGGWAGGLVGAGRAGSWVGAALGLAAAFLGFFRLARKLSR
jgi:hypothetical protein